MKKAISIILVTAMIVSCLSLSGISAAAAETEKPTVYLIGDVNLDGKLSVGDVTELQRSLAGFSELSGLQTELGRDDYVNDVVENITRIVNRELLSL